TITVIVNASATQQPDKTMFVNLSSPGNATISRAQAVGTIHTNQPPTLAAVANQALNQGQAGTVTLNGSDPENDALTYSAQAETQAYWLKTTYGLYQDPG